jgi:adenylate cyclase
LGQNRVKKKIFGRSFFFALFTVIGDVVTITQRLQSAAKAGQIIISKEIYERVKDSFNCQVVGDITVKHKSQPIKIYEVID